MKYLKISLKSIPIILIILFFALQLYSISIKDDGDKPLPDQFGNFNKNIAFLEKQPAKNEFTFAVIGDTKSVGTFEALIKKLRKEKLDFVVLLGDCSYGGTEDKHKYFRAECAEEYALSCPTFYVVGNHDVSLDQFPIKRFEELYGTSIFKFVYQNHLFIFLRVLSDPYTNEESIQYLLNLNSKDLEKYAQRTVFMHIPPNISSNFKVRKITGQDALIKEFHRLNINTVFSGDFHGFAEVDKDGVKYLISGGGGAHLNKKICSQFHHALITTIENTSTHRRFIYVEEENQISERLEKFGITYAWPFIRDNMTLVIICDSALIIILIMLIYSIRKRRKCEIKSIPTTV